MPDIKLSKTQTRCWEYLNDDKTTEILYGGGVAGGKSFILCLWVITQCIQYPETRHLIGRTVLQTLKLTTLKTFFQVCNMMGLKPVEHYNYNQQNNVITFYNGSEVILKDLQYQPSDPDANFLGSLEITSASIDEAQQVDRNVYSVLKSRIRYKLIQYNLKPKILLTANPGTNFIKTDFYDPWVKEELPDNIQFVQSLITDNPHISQDYIDNLNTLPTIQKRRLLYGDWSYNEDESSVFNIDSITSSLFRNIPNNKDQKYLSCDIARFGSDSTVIVVWVGLTIVDIKVLKKLDTVEVSNEIRDLIKFHGIHPNNIIVDSDGIGGSIVDQIRTKPFLNGSKALHDENFQNLKTQCYVKLSELFNDGKISINIDNPTIIDTLTQELMVIKYTKVDQDTKVSITSKDESKRLLGRSPDISDAVMMRTYFELKNNKTTGKYSIRMI